MALGAKAICRHPGCGKLIDVAGYCPAHVRVAAKQSDATRGTSSERGYNYRWQKARRTFLTAHPLCRHCRLRGMVRTATEVDHVIPHRGDQALFWDTGNWQPLCKPCHSRKTASEDGGYGQARAAPRRD